jgi:hypothetical protein
MGLLVTGLPRSGTSWVGKMLEAGGDVVYVNEPLNPQHPPGRSPGVLNADVTHRFQYICADNEEPWRRAFSDTLALRYHAVAELRRNHRAYDLARFAKYWSAFTIGRARGRKAMLDDPYAVLSAAWFATRMNVATLVLVRDPVALVGSWRKLGWTVDFRELLGQPLLMRDLLSSYERRMTDLLESDDHVARVALLWRMTYEVIACLLPSVPGVRLRRYEDLAGSPQAEFRSAYSALGLAWTAQAERAVRAATGDDHREGDGEAPGHERADDGEAPGPGPADDGRDGDSANGARPRPATGVADREPADDGGGGGFAWSLRGGLSRTAFRPMDSKALLAAQADRLTAAERARVREITGDVAERIGYGGDG